MTSSLLLLLAACAPDAPDATFDATGARFEGGLRIGAAGGWRTDGARQSRTRAGTTEWWEPRDGAWEHGFDVETGGDTIDLVIPVEGARVVDTGRGIALRQPGHLGHTYDGLVVVDDAGRRLDAELGADPAGIRLHVDTRGATWPVHIDPTLTPGQWIAAPTTSKYFGSGLAVGDLDGDGHDDAVASYTSYGQLSVYMGSASGLPDTPSGSVTAASSGTVNVTGIGDVDGDGYDDIAEWTTSSTLTIHYGSVDGLVSAATSTVTVSTSNALNVLRAGDVDGDGYDDVLIGQPGWEDAQTNEGRVLLYLGGPTGLATSSTWTWDSDVTSLGAGNVMAAGDWNGDGRPDLAIGGSNYTDGETREGAVFVFFGGSSLASYPDLIFEGGTASNGAGTGLANVPDQDGDGDDELLVQYYQTGGTSTCGAYLQHGGATGISESPEPGAFSLTCIENLRLLASADYNGDGIADLQVSEPSSSAGGSNYEGLARIYPGSSTGFSTTPIMTAYGIAPESYLGTVITAGDFDGDGADDALISAYRYSSSTGRLLVAYGDPERVQDPTSWSDMLQATGSSESSFGRVLVDAGDTNGDGYGDLAVARNYQTTYVFPGSATDLGTPDSFGSTSTSVANRGLAAADIDQDGYNDVLVGGGAPPEGGTGSVVSVYLGSPAGADDIGWTLQADHAATDFGSVVVTGDFNDDGWPDVATSSPYNTWGYTYEGSIYVYYGSAAGLSATEDWYWDGDETYAYAGTSLIVGDFDGDGVDDLAVGAPGHMAYETTEGGVYVFQGGAAGFGLHPDWTISCTHTTEACGSALAAGDFDADGYDELVVGASGYDADTDDVGAVHIYRGSAAGLGDDPTWDFVGDQANSDYGEVLATGDVDGDGDVDLVIGAPGYQSFAIADGRAWVYANVGGTFAEPSWLSTDEPNAHFGGAAVVADVDADGSGELFIASPDSKSCASCSPSRGGRVYRWDLEDNDGDGDFSISDCDDADASLHAGADEACDGIDNDCDGEVDEASTWYRDADGDGYGSTTSTTAACAAPSGYVANADDCDDSDASVSPGAVEACDSVDNDCDGAADESGDTALAWYTDGDGDGFGDSSTLTYACSAPSSTSVRTGGDCDDDDPGETTGGDWYRDADGDGYGDTTTVTTSCDAPTGFVSDGSDCDDVHAGAHPGGTEACDGYDDDCDGSIDEGVAPTWYADLDGDGYGDGTATVSSCAAPSGYVSNPNDCDDVHAAANPDAIEICDGYDDDCDGGVDEGVVPTWYVDSDADGFGTSTLTIATCTMPAGYAANASDCDDTRAEANPDGTETCDGVDDDCDGSVDEDVMATWYGDTDGDGHGGTTLVTTACSAPGGYVSTADDCDDGDGAVHPGAAEVCDGLDQNCDGAADEGSSATSFADADGDGYGDPASPTPVCPPPGGYVDNALDCDDAATDVNPGATETCDGLDNDCDGLTDGVDAEDVTAWYMDGDADGYGAGDAIEDCDPVEGRVDLGGDCDDSDAGVSPAATETWYDGIDQDCDGVDDDQDGDGFVLASDCDDEDAAINPDTVDTWYDGVDSNCDGADDFDADADGHTSASYSGDDCDDANAAVYPGAPDAPYDSLDGDCSGGSDDDADGDGHDASFAGGDDCDDARSDTYPGATEVWYDGIDQDCDGNDADQDGDGYALPYDCADEDPAINPAATEVPDNEVDEDCDGHAQMTEATEVPETEDKDTGEESGGEGCSCTTANAGSTSLLALAALALARRRRGAR